MSKRSELMKRANYLLSDTGVQGLLDGFTDGESWETTAEGTRQSRVGFIWIQRADCQAPAYRLAQMTSTGGGERNLTANYTLGELVAYLEAVRDTLDRATGRNKTYT